MVISWQKGSWPSRGDSGEVCKQVSSMFDLSLKWAYRPHFSLLISQYLEVGVVAWGFEKSAQYVWGMDAAKVSRSSPRLEKNEVTGADY